MGIAPKWLSVIHACKGRVMMTLHCSIRMLFIFAVFSMVSTDFSDEDRELPFQNIGFINPDAPYYEVRPPRAAFMTPWFRRLWIWLKWQEFLLKAS